MNHRETQRDRVLQLLQSYDGRWCPLPKILELNIAQFGARILELRRQGHAIENKQEKDFGGVMHSWYRLVPKNEQLSLLGAPTDLVKNA